MNPLRFRLFKRSLVITLVLAVTVAIGMAIWQHRVGFTATGDTIANAKPYFLLFRLVTAAVLISGWTYWMNYLARTKDWSDAHLQHAVSLRWRVLGWLIVLELLVGQNLLRHLLHHLLALF